MDIIRKHGLWIIAGVIVIFAIGFYFTAVRKLAKERSAKITEIETRRDNLKKHADKPKDIPGPNWVNLAAAHAQEVAAQIENCAEYLANQPRNGHTRRFFEDERSGMGKEVTEEIVWESRLETHVIELQRQLEAAGLGGWVPEVPTPWTGGVPEDAQIQEAQEVYWFVKDLADALTGQVEEDFQEHLDASADSRGGAFRKPSDLVINRRLTGDQSLDALIRLLPQDRLEAVLEAILINEGHADLPTIFDTHLKDLGFSWERVLGLTMDDEQAQFLDELIPAGNDLANRQRFIDYVMELRTVRYRSDVIGLLENHDDGGNNRFAYVASRVKEVSPLGRARLLQEIRQDWNQTRIAQTIATIVSVYDDKDYRLLRDNHNPQIVDLSSVSITRPYVATTSASNRRLGAGGLGTGGVGLSQGGVGGRTTDYFKTTGFEMTVTIELEHLPVLLRRLLSNSWYYSIAINSVEPTDRAGGSGVGGRRGGGLGGGGARRPGVRPSANILRGGAGDARTGSTVAPRNYVIVDITGEGYQFTPLRKALESETKEPAASRSKPAPAKKNTDSSAPAPETSSDDRP